MISLAKILLKSNKIVHDRFKPVSHEHTKVTESNCCVLQYTGKSYKVLQHCDDCKAVKGAPVMHAATA